MTRITHIIRMSAEEKRAALNMWKKKFIPMGEQARSQKKKKRIVGCRKDENHTVPG